MTLIPERAPFINSPLGPSKPLNCSLSFLAAAGARSQESCNKSDLVEERKTEPGKEKVKVNPGPGRPSHDGYLSSVVRGYGDFEAPCGEIIVIISVLLKRHPPPNFLPGIVPCLTSL